ncbi:dynein axonemal heavy chain 6-like [Schistocerca serialis cubense]|uniref:dynein axonemal heavy chain 6-like n=1 Tax=Schistocerca serialis cubense TaxID=2023355 RepID=UPI00214E8DD8|nr:dynein axonemal heavy chain 6-like [Schistocerca serialis cubense]
MSMRNLTENVKSVYKPPVHTAQRKEKKEVTDIMKPTSMLEVADQRSLIELVRRNKKIGFLYMTYAVPRSSKFFTPYCLRVVPYKNIDKQNFLTISSEGVTQFYPGDMVFTSLQQWEYEYDRYCNLILIKTFSMFRMWKGFYVWRKNVKWKKIHDARKSLNELLFLLNPALRKALLDVQLACNKMVEVYFTDFSNKEKNILFEFMNAQVRSFPWLSLAQFIISFTATVGTSIGKFTSLMQPNFANQWELYDVVILCPQRSFNFGTTGATHSCSHLVIIWYGTLHCPSVKRVWFVTVEIRYEDVAHLFEFISCMKNLVIVREQLLEYRDIVKELINCACHKALLSVGFTTDDHNFLIQPTSSATSGAKRSANSQFQMSYMKQINKRRFCTRLTSFIHLIDLMMVGMLHVLVVRSLLDLDKTLQMHLHFLPNDEALNSLATDVNIAPQRPSSIPQHILPRKCTSLLLSFVGDNFDIGTLFCELMYMTYIDQHLGEEADKCVIPARTCPIFSIETSKPTLAAIFSNTSIQNLVSTTLFASSSRSSASARQLTFSRVNDLLTFLILFSYYFLQSGGKPAPLSATWDTAHGIVTATWHTLLRQAVQRRVNFMRWNVVLLFDDATVTCGRNSRYKLYIPPRVYIVSIAMHTKVSMYQMCIRVHNRWTDVMNLANVHIYGQYSTVFLEEQGKTARRKEHKRKKQTGNREQLDKEGSNEGWTTQGLDGRQPLGDIIICKENVIIFDYIEILMTLAELMILKLIWLFYFERKMRIIKKNNSTKNSKPRIDGCRIYTYSFIWAAYVSVQNLGERNSAILSLPLELQNFLYPWHVLLEWHVVDRVLQHIFCSIMLSPLHSMTRSVEAVIARDRHLTKLSQHCNPPCGTLPVVCSLLDTGSMSKNVNKIRPEKELCLLLYCTESSQRTIKLEQAFPRNGNRHDKNHGTDIIQNSELHSLLVKIQTCEDLFCQDGTASILLNISLRLLIFIHSLESKNLKHFSGAIDKHVFSITFASFNVMFSDIPYKPQWIAHGRKIFYFCELHVHLFPSMDIMTIAANLRMLKNNLQEEEHCIIISIIVLRERRVHIAEDCKQFLLSCPAWCLCKRKQLYHSTAADYDWQKMVLVHFQVESTIGKDTLTTLIHNKLTANSIQITDDVSMSKTITRTNGILHGDPLSPSICNIATYAVGHIIRNGGRQNLRKCGRHGHWIKLQTQTEKSNHSTREVGTEELCMRHPSTDNSNKPLMKERRRKGNSSAWIPPRNMQEQEFPRPWQQMCVRELCDQLRDSYTNNIVLKKELEILKSPPPNTIAFTCPSSITCATPVIITYIITMNSDGQDGHLYNVAITNSALFIAIESILPVQLVIIIIYMPYSFYYNNGLYLHLMMPHIILYILLTTISHKLPLFIINLLIDEHTLLLDPPERAYIESLSQLMDFWEETVININTFLPDPYFKPFTEQGVSGCSLAHMGFTNDLLTSHTNILQEILSLLFVYMMKALMQATSIIQKNRLGDQVLYAVVCLEYHRIPNNATRNESTVNSLLHEILQFQNHLCPISLPDFGILRLLMLRLGQLSICLLSLSAARTCGSSSRLSSSSVLVSLPMICGKAEGRLCGTGPEIDVILKEDKHRLDIRTNIILSIHNNFEAINKYIQRFQFIREFHTVNTATDMESITNETEYLATTLIRENLTPQSHIEIFTAKDYGALRYLPSFYCLLYTGKSTAVCVLAFFSNKACRLLLIKPPCLSETVFKINMKYHEYVQSFSISIEMIVNVVTSVTIRMKINQRLQKITSYTLCWYGFAGFLNAFQNFVDNWLDISCQNLWGKFVLVLSDCYHIVSHLYLKLFCLTCQQAFSPNFNFLLLAQTFHLSKCCVKVVFVVIWTHNTTKNALSEVHSIVLSRCTLAYDKTLLMHTAFKCPAPGSGGALRLASEAEEMALVAVLVAVLEKVHQLHPPMMENPLHVFSVTQLPQVIREYLLCDLGVNIIDRCNYNMAYENIIDRIMCTCLACRRKQSEQLSSQQKPDAKLQLKKDLIAIMLECSLHSQELIMSCISDSVHDSSQEHVSWHFLPGPLSKKWIHNNFNNLNTEHPQSLSAAVTLMCLIVWGMIGWQRVFGGPAVLSVVRMLTIATRTFSVEEFFCAGGNFMEHSFMEKFRKLLTSYHQQIDDINKLQDSQDIGIFQLVFERLKGTVLPVTTALLGAVELTLPRSERHFSPSFCPLVVVHTFIDFLNRENKIIELLYLDELHIDLQWKCCNYSQNISLCDICKELGGSYLFLALYEHSFTWFSIIVALWQNVQYNIVISLSPIAWKYTNLSIDGGERHTLEHDQFFLLQDLYPSYKKKVVVVIWSFPCKLGAEKVKGQTIRTDLGIFTQFYIETLNPKITHHNSKLYHFSDLSVKDNCFKGKENSNKRRETLVVLYLNIGASLKIDVFKSVCRKLLWWKLLLSHQEELIATCVNDKFRSTSWVQEQLTSISDVSRLDPLFHKMKERARTVLTWVIETKETVMICFIVKKKIIEVDMKVRILRVRNHLKSREVVQYQFHNQHKIFREQAFPKLKLSVKIINFGIDDPIMSSGFFIYFLIQCSLYIYKTNIRMAHKGIDRLLKRMKEGRVDFNILFIPTAVAKTICPVGTGSSGSQRTIFKANMANEVHKKNHMNCTARTKSNILLSQNFRRRRMPHSKCFRHCVFILFSRQGAVQKIGKEKIDDLITEAGEAQAFLELEPRTTIQFVEYLTFLDSAQHKVDMMETQMDYCKELYDIIDEFQIPCAPEDQVNYLGFSVTLSALRSVVDGKLTEYPKILSKFDDQINRDISSLFSDVGDVKDEVTQPWLIDVNSNPEEVKLTLNMLSEQLAEFQKKAAEYRGYQRQFKLEITKFELLDEVLNDVKLRQLLWESVEKWDKLIQEWYEADFSTLDPEEMNVTTMRFIKNILQLEKGLPENLILPQLKYNVELMKDKMAVVTYLRNPSLKPRHWLQIEGVLKYKFPTEEPITLRLLECIGVFTFPDELQEISGQASSESGLESLLQKVEDAWKTIEFVVLPHRDSKDVFILGGLEEIQQVLDDSNINMSTITSSRHVGPIKPRVDEWASQLQLFSNTLDAWMLCQQGWMYLESIFSAPDIQRQLPQEDKMFNIVDKSFKDIMRRTAENPLAMQACTAPGLLETFNRNNVLLDQIMKCLEAYLETKRVAFPRFYFLSNDELLEILAQTRNPFAVQPHLRKCFDAIAKLEFGVHEKEGESGETAATVMTTDIVAMISPEGERVALGQGLYARGNVEDWLGKVEEYMFLTLRKRMKFAIGDHNNNEREVWVVSHPAQIILTVSLIIWCENVHLVFMPDKNIKQALSAFEKKCFQDLNSLAAMVRGDLSKLNRMIICSLITIDVHARDIITSLVKLNVQNSSHFEWLKQLRYYWEEDIDNCVARMSSACYVYGYEYLGASPRLVITPLTDKCYLCLMGALQLDLGGAPAGPAGTGKTETTKDLAKSLAIQCVVFNCSEGLDYKMMGRFFSGLAQSGAWCCFDEFNRIDIEVLSVIAQQLITIRNAKAAKLARFVFEGREIKLIQTCAAFITMNPGYAGRTELPDNLKALFRPISMMVPDYALIAEVILYSEGFESSKNLANKMVQMYKLCSEQLSQQDHYDFGMRAVKSVLVMAGSLKRENPDKSEDVVLIRALRDSNLPKFLTDDATLFQGILGDLFPGVEIPEQDYGVLQAAIITVMEENDLQPESCMIAKVIQFHETMIVRHGVMLVGPTGGGKTTVINVLKDTLTRLHADGVPGPVYRPVITYVLNPKSVTLGELYGEVNLLTMEWRDGLLGIMVRTAVQCEDEIHQWVICDGPVDAVWIENMNTVLDDNKMLCLANSERIKLTPWVHMVFEVQDLAQASPATVSRCGMVYIDPEELQYMPYVNTWLKNLGAPMPPELKDYVRQLYEGYVDKGLTFVKKNCNHAIAQVDISKATMLCGLMESLIMSPGSIDKTSDASRIKNFLCQAYVFSYLWSLGGNLTDASQEKFEIFVKEQFDDHPDARLPAADDLWSVYVNIPQKRMSLWSSIVPAFQFDREMPFFEMLVPTTDTVRFGYVTERLLSVKRHVLLTGDTGVGKSVIAKEVLNKLLAQGDHITVALNFSAQTSSGRTQEIFEAKLERRKKTVLGPPLGKKLVFFVDDVNMPKLDTYGAQPPIELLRQYLDFGGLYDREKLFWKEIQDVVIIAACAPPGGGRNPLTPRFVRHFSMLFIPSPSEFTLKNIFKVILRGFLSDFTNPVKDLGDIIVNSAVEIYNRISEDLLPTPAKSHYVFNLRDLSKCIQGVLQADAGTVREAIQMMRLFYHECLRVFHDRLINIEDKSYFYKLMYEVCNRTYGDPVIQLPEEEIILHPPVLLFGDFMVMGASKEDKVYEEITDIEKFKKVAQDYLEDYNLTTPKEMKLIFFMDALEHITRLARILRAERGNGLLVGVGGMGKQSLTRLAAHLCGYKCFQIELTRNYDHASFHDDLRLLYFNAGALNQDTAFLFTDSQIVSEEFLEDINNILNSGEVPNLFESDEYEKVIIASRNDAKEAGIDEGNRDGIFEFFISRVRSRLHLVLCMSPVGDAFRRRCRMFPSLVNCCTIDWFVEWPQEALLSVASTTLAEVGSEELIEKLSTMCVTIHESVAQMTIRFYNEMRRYYYTTPSSYLELLKLYLTMLQNKTDQLQKKHDRIANGLRKLYETNELIDRMKIELTAMEPELKQKSIDAVELMKHLVKEQAQADKVRKIVVADEAVVKVKAQETQQLADEAQRDLDAALPAMEAAMKALESLNKNDINELRVFTKPPQLVKFVMESVCLLMGVKTDWASAKTLLGDTNFLKRLQDYEKDNITDNMLKKLKQYVDHPDFTPETVAGVSKVCKSICMWVRAIDCYAKAYRVVQPKKAKLAAAEQELNQIMSVLREKQQALAAVEKQIADLEATYDRSVNEKAELERMMELTANRLVRAGHLTTALGDEQLRWEKSVKDLKEALITVVGDVLVAAACVAYLGAFTNNYRVELVQKWVEHIMALEIPASEVFSLISVLADPFEIRQWNVYGLPRDNVSTENAIMVTKGSRWPLMIDPQEQASRWIRQMESENQIKIVKLTDAGFMRSLEGAVRVGMPVLLEELGETLDPTLGPILLRQTFVQGGRLLIHLGDSDVEYDPNFRFYMTTKLSNPHYLPEVCIQVTIVNFTVTRSGLEDQLLSDVVRLERPDLEKQRNELITRINNDKTQLQNIEDKILRMLFTSEGNILDDEELIETLNKSKETSGTIAARLVEAEATEQKISVAREKYRTVAARGSVLYFVVAQLAEIDPMYQYSLRYFNQVFNTVIETSEKSDILDVRLMTLLAAITLAVYTNVSRGLFERHKLVFSFLLCINILKHAGEITEAQWGFLLRGPMSAKKDLPKKPDIPTLSDAMWMAVNFLDDAFPSFKGITNDALKAIPVMIGTFKQVINLTNDSAAPIVESWDQTLSMFEKLMLLKALKEEKLVFAITAFVREKQGQSFIESPQVSLHVLYKDTSNVVPLIFVLSTGSDPFGAFQRFATEKGFRDRILSISLGQGQGPVAEKLIGTGTANGDWVFLQNCHLATSWMLSMEKIIIGFSENPEQVNPDFRLFLSSMPSKSFPVSVLQNSVKVTNEPPKGLRANIKRAFLELTEDFFEDHPLGPDWRKMIFGICFFHGVIQERKKFGPLGWNITYEFNDSDRECALNTMKMFCAENSIPWDALEYITGEITYGGRVTDSWDLRCLKTILKGFFSPKILKSGYIYSASGVYYCPESEDFSTLEQYRNFIDQLPIIEEPEIFGMHENANIAFQVNETQTVILTILDVQPRESSGAEGKSSDEIIFELADAIRGQIRKKLDPDEIHPSLLVRDEKGRLPSLTTVLLQETDRFNKLCHTLHSSLDNLQKAIKGLVVMSEALEEMFISCMNNQVPKMWATVGYLSLKSLGSWIRDLETRLDFIQTWLTSGQPISFWISGFFFPQGFLTGTLQTHARKYELPIDQLKFEFTVQKVVLDQELLKAAHYQAEGKEVPEMYEGLKRPSDGVLVHGIFLDASRWDLQTMTLCDPNPGEMNPPLPVTLLTPVTALTYKGIRYVAPLYKTSERAGVLSTTGHSTNFVIAFYLPSKQEESYWILKGAALLTQITD